MNASVKLDLLRRQLAAGRPVRIRAWGASMHPTLVAGDLVEVSPLAGDPLVGEVVVAAAGSEVTVHRLVALDGGECLLQGDNLAEPDPWRPLGDLVGTVASVPSAAPLAWGLPFLAAPERLAKATPARRQAFARLVETQALLPWVGALVRSGTVGAEDLPEGFATRARKAYTLNHVVTAKLAECQAALVAALDRHGVTVLALKGLALGALLHGDLAARSQQDLDLLVRRRDVRAAGHVLATLGYAAERPRRLRRFHLAWHYDQTFSDPAGEKVELHWDLTQPGSHRISLPGLFERAVPVSGRPELGRTLAPEDLVVYLALHAALDDRCLVLRSHLELAGLAGRPDLDWDLVVERARAGGVSRACWLALEAAARLVGAPVPMDVLRALEPSPRQVRRWRERLPLTVLLSRASFDSVTWRDLRACGYLSDRASARARRAAVQALKALGARASRKPPCRPGGSG